MFPQDNNQVMLLVFSGLAFLLPISWCIVHKHTQDTPLGELWQGSMRGFRRE